MKNESPTINTMRAEATAHGEIESVTGDLVTVKGTFSAGLAIDLRPGRRVLILTEEDGADIYDYTHSQEGLEL